MATYENYFGTQFSYAAMAVISSEGGAYARALVSFHDPDDDHGHGHGDHEPHIYESISTEFATKLALIESGLLATVDTANEDGGSVFAGPDIAGDSTTTATLAIGGSQTSEIEIEGDEDWFAVELVAGTSYRFTVTGDTLLDPTMSLHDAAGNELEANDDSGGLDSAINFTASSSGTYYISASSFTGNSGDDIGTYTVAAAELEPITEVRTIDGVANFLTDEFSTRKAFASNDLTYNIEGLTSEAQILAEASLEAWAEITGITFTRNTNPNFDGSGADIIFDDDQSGAFASTTTSGSMEDGTRIIQSARINIDVNWFGGNKSLDSYTYQTYLHEIGHALGLGHAGPYNGSATYGLDNVYANDTWAFTVMSYFDQNEAGYGDYRFVLGPAIADIVAIQDLYGANPDGTRIEDTTYGFNSTEDDVNDWSQFVTTTGSRPPSMSIYDTGGIDTIDLSGYSNDQRLNLNSETFSDLGDRGSSDSYSGVISIARDTIIENAIGGSGNDQIFGNEVANTLNGGAGDDILFGGQGDDTLIGGEGADTYIFNIGDGADVISDYELGVDVIDVAEFSLAQIDAMLESAAAVDGGVQFTLPEGGSLTLQGVSMSDLGGVQFIGPAGPVDPIDPVDPVDPSEFNQIIATDARETLVGTDAADAFIFESNTSTLSDIDTIQNWQPGDVIDLSALGLSEGDLEARLVSGGSTLKLIEGFGSNDFQLRIDLGEYSIQDVLDSIIYDGPAEPLNVITGTDEDENLFGTEDADEIFGLDGDDQIFSYGGDDTLRGGDGADVLNGGLGNDTLIGGGNSTSPAGDIFVLGAGDDTMIGSVGSNDYIVAGLNTDPASTTPIVVDFEAGQVTSDGYGGTDTFSDIPNALIIGFGDDTISGNDQDNRLQMYGGGEDTILGMGGDDAISVEFAGGLIDGGEGTDLLRFYDVISVQAPYDRVQREAGVHIDLELGLVIDDGYGNQSTVLNIENLRGTNQADVLIGDSGENVLTSELGDDVIEGGAGNDTISLSGGADTIVMSTGDDADTVSGFSVADQDRIDVSGFNLTAAEALALVQQNGADTFIDFGNGDSILLRDVTATDLTEANFIGGTTPPSSDFNDIIATAPRETLIGTSAADRFLFADGTSTTSDIDVVRDWQPGDIIDLSGTGLTLADLETRLISGGNTLKLIEGFGGDDFQLKIELGGYSVDDILASLVFDGTPPENRAPDAVNDTATAVLTDPVIIDALANDSDPDGDLIALVDFQQASNGAVTLNTDGTFTYTANADFTGADSFTYRIQDEDGAISEATVTVTVGDGTPTPYNDIVATDARETLIGTSAADRFVFADGTSTTGDIDVLRDWQPGDIIDLSDTGLTLDDLETRLISDGNTLKLIEGFGADDFQLKIELGGYSVEDVLASVVTGPQTTESFAENAFDFSGLQPASPVSVEEEYLAQSKPITPIAEVQFAWNDTEMWDANSFDLDHAFQMDDSGLWILA